MKVTNHLFIEFSRIAASGKMPSLIDLNSDQQAELLIIVMTSEDDEARQVLHEAIISSDVLQGILVAGMITAADKYRRIEDAICEHVQLFIQGKIDDFNAIMHAKNVVSLAGVRMNRCLNEDSARPSRKIQIVDFDRSMCEALYYGDDEDCEQQAPIDPMDDAGHNPRDFH